MSIIFAVLSVIVLGISGPASSLTTAALKQSSTAVSTSKHTFNYLVSFGDSYSQTGFNISGTKPSLSNQLGNPAYPGYTTSGGPNWVGHITSKNPGILSYNFASGGATTDASLVTPYQPTVLSFIDQVTQFKTNLSPPPSYAPWKSNNTLFAIWIGVNDVGNAWSNSTWSTLSQQIISRYFEQAQILYDAGGRSFAFLNVPPIQRTPMMMKETAANQQTIITAIAHYNDLLTAGVATFMKKNTDLSSDSVLVIDTQSPFNAILNNPTAYGAPNASCYNSDGVSCVWWNNYHPGQKIQSSVGDAVDTAFA